MVKRSDAKRKPSLSQNLTHYHVVGRAAPSKKNPNPLIYRMNIFAKNAVLAKGRFWYFMRKLQKAKRSGGEILACNVLLEPKPTKVKNYGVLLRYECRTGIHNMYKEYRDTTLTGAISQMYGEMAGRDKARASCIQIIRAREIADADCRKVRTTQLHNTKLKFPILRPQPLVTKADRETFADHRPSLSL
ncbi:60S ribosomal protein L18ae, putative [Babesia bigemina]|uniref:60S ribosomal protein L18a n=1 Tax=Babesia bigemina TaxID=5866 RepID=A0A061D9A5_BABBI|nr:60S ribosomal protein L18ae, putative [Babesia bigemina]CDR97128.1 60S ribosomal protein L18ae, putative [Babesia bigemina]|eukprot:XP_012769314.1 60S ribosomal protein L18ae, putative [Babesia bigemina]